ncbi:MAG TPA: tetratricopeptide repeat protein [Casimicrobiaceae bacterium]
MTDSAALLRQALALHHAGRLREAQLIYSRVLTEDPDNAEALHLSGLVAFRESRFDDAIALLRRAVVCAPGNALYLGNLGNALKDAGRHDEAIATYERALELDPDQVSARSNLGAMHLETGTLEDAIREFRDVIARKPDHVRAHFNLGNALLRSGNVEAAERAYRRTLALNPDFAEALAQLALLLRTLNRHDEALALLRRRAVVDPESVQAHAELALALVRSGELEGALASYQNALAVAPDALDVRCSFCALLQKICDWERLTLHVRDVLQALEQGRAGVPPNLFVSLHDVTPAMQLEAARANAAALGARRSVSTHRVDSTATRLRIGYLAASFRAHATPYSTGQLFSLHDRGQCEVFVFSVAPDGEGGISSSLRGLADQVFDIAALSDEDCARRIAECNIDILVDLNGNCDGGRMGIAAFRPAPIQVNALGFPGTLGAPWYDYLVADRHVVPPGAEPLYAEEIVRVPDCYQCDARTPTRPSTAPPRASDGLPSNAVILCCFSPAFKITAPMFALWLRVLAEVPDAMLWLLEDNTLASSSLRRRAARQRIDPERLLFAPRLPHDEHLARYCRADLAIDTFPSTSNTAARDALWMGCPLVTLTGDTFASRVATSLLANVGLAELCAISPARYEELIVDLARDSARREMLRDKLDHALGATPLFDLPRFVRNLERAYAQMAAHAAAGGTPKGFDLR